MLAQQRRFPVGGVLQAVVPQHPPDEGRQGRKQVHRERLGAAVARVEPDQEVPDLLRYLVGDDRRRGDDAELGAVQERRGDQYAVDEGVDRVADHDERAAASLVVPLRVAIMHFAVLGVAMAPEHSFSSTKKPKMPARIALAASCGGPLSNACGITSRNAAPSSAPTACRRRNSPRGSSRGSWGAGFYVDPDRGRHATLPAI